MRKKFIRRPPRAAAGAVGSPKIDANPRGYVLALLARRDYSRRQLEQKLKRRGNAPEKIEEVLSQLERSGLFREASYASARMRAFARKGYGPSWIKSKLRGDGVTVDKQALEGAFEEVGADDGAQVRDLVAKQLKTAAAKLSGGREFDVRALKRKVMNAVAVKGHAFSAVGTEFDKQFKKLRDDLEMSDDER